MAVETSPPDGCTYRLRQHPDPMVNNLIGCVHGGVSSAGLEPSGRRRSITNSRARSDGVAAGEFCGRTSPVHPRVQNPLQRGNGAADRAHVGDADAAAIGLDGWPAVIAPSPATGEHRG